MTKRILILIILLIMVTACGSLVNSGRDTYDEGYEVAYDAVSDSIERAPGTQNIQFAQSQVLPPYGVKAVAEIAVLELQIRSSAKQAEDRIEDIQNAVAEIAALASANEAIEMGETAVHQVNGSYAREEHTTSNIPDIDTSAVTIKLTSALSHDADFGQSIVAFNQFLNNMDLPDTISVQALSVKTELGDLEALRNQIIAQVYQELDAVKAQYGQATKFEVTGLHTPLKMIQLSDIEYYLYLEPIITVIEF